MHTRLWAALAILVLTASLAAAEEKPAARADQYGDPLPEGAVARLGTVRLRARCAQCLAFSRDGKLLATGNSDRTARLWDTVTGREVVRFRGSGLGQVDWVALSPDAATLATLDGDGVVQFWDAKTGKHLRAAEAPVGYHGADAVSAFTFSPDGRRLYLGAGKSLQVITVADGKFAAPPTPPERGLSIDAVAPDGGAAVSDAGGRLVVWDLESGKVLARVTAPPKRTWFALSPGSKRLAVATADEEPAVVVYDLADGKELCRCRGHQAELSSLAFSPDGKSLATGSRDLTARLWDAESGKERWSYRAFTVNFYWVSVAFAPDGKTVGVAGWDGIVRLLEAKTGKERVPVPGHLAEVGSLAVTPDGKAVFTSGNDQSLRLWDVESGKELRVLKGPGVDVYDPKQRKVVHADEWTHCLGVTLDGNGLAVAARGVRLWDVSDPDRPRAGAVIDDGWRAALAPDGKTLVTLRDKLRLVDVRSGKVLREIRIEDGDRLCFSPDGRTLAVGGQREVIRLYDVRTWQERAVLRGGGVQAISRIVFSPDGQLLAASDADWRVNVWEVASGRLRRRIERKESMMDALAFSPDGRYLALGGMSETISLHHVSSGQVVHTFRGHEEDVICLAFTPDGRRLISGSKDTTALVWDMRALTVPTVGEVKRTAKELDGLWERLAGDAEKADAAMRDMAASPAQAVELLARSVRPAEKGQAERIARLVRDLDHDSFAERERASTALEELGEEAAEPLRAALEGKPSAELRRRAEELLERLKSKGPSPARLRVLRAVEVLEWIDTAEARRALEAVAAGAPDAERTRAAAAALACLKKR